MMLQAAARSNRLELVILVFIIRCVLIGCEETCSRERVDGLCQQYLSSSRQEMALRAGESPRISTLGAVTRYNRGPIAWPNSR
jgi:hypothetical protein